MTYDGIAVVQDILSVRILIEKVVGSLRGTEPPDVDIVDRLVQRLSEDARAGTSTARRIRSRAGTYTRSETVAQTARSADPEIETVPLLRKLASRQIGDQDVSKLAELLTSVDQALDRSRTRMAPGRFL